MINFNATAKQAFEWVKTGHWSMATFNQWLQYREENTRQAGYDAGYNSAYNEYNA